MPAIKFSQLSTLNTVQSGTIIPVVYNGTNYKLTVDLLKGYITPTWSEVKNKPTFAEVAFSGDYSVLVNKPTIPTRVSQLEVDVNLGDTAVWTSIIGKPTFATVATSGSYADLINKPNLTVYVTATGLTSILSSYTTQTYVTSQGYITTGSLTWNNITGKPTFATVATSGRYGDLSDKPLNLSNFNNDIGIGSSTSNGWQLTSSTQVVSLDSSGTLHTPLLLPKAFTAVLDEAHRTVGDGSYTGPAWEFHLEWQCSQNGQVVLMADNPLPSLVAGYANGQTFEFTEADHGIPGYTLSIVLSNVQHNPAGYTANLNYSEPPSYPSTVKSLGAIKLTSNENSWTFGTDGVITLPENGDIVDSNGLSVLGGGSTGTSWNLTSQGNGCPIDVTLTTTTFDVQVPRNHLFFRENGSWDIGSYVNETYITGDTSGGNGIALVTDRGTVLFGNSPEICGPTLASHFHIMRDDPTTVDLFFGDDLNYVKLPYDSTLTNVGVEIGTDATNLWSFGTDGVLRMPDGNLGSDGRIDFNFEGYNWGRISSHNRQVYIHSVEDNGDNPPEYGKGTVLTELAVGLDVSISTNAQDIAPNNWVFGTNGWLKFPIGEVTIGTSTETQVTYFGSGVDGGGSISFSPTGNTTIVGSQATVIDAGFGAETPTRHWTFGTDGKLTLPAGGDIVDSNGLSVLGGNANTGNYTFNGDTISNPAGFTFDAAGHGIITLGTFIETPGVAEHFHIAFPNSNVETPYQDLYLGNDFDYVKIRGSHNEQVLGVDIGAGGQRWEFNPDGTTIFPNNKIDAGDNTLLITAGDSVSQIEMDNYGSIQLTVNNPDFDPISNPLGGAFISLGGDLGLNEILSTEYLGPTLAVGTAIQHNGSLGEMLGIWTVDKDGNLITAKANLYNSGVSVETGDIRDNKGNSLVYVPASDTAPTHNLNGLLWFNTQEGRTYIKYNDQWVDASPTVIPPPAPEPTRIVSGDNTVSVDDMGVVLGTAQGSLSLDTSGVLKFGTTGKSTFTIGELRDGDSVIWLDPGSRTEYVGLWWAGNTDYANSGYGPAAGINIGLNGWDDSQEAVDPDTQITLGIGQLYWQFDADGVLHLPEGGDIVDWNGTTVLGGGGGSGWQITSGTYNVSVADTGVVTMATSRGNIEFGALPEFGGSSHFHIMKSSSSTDVDLYFGDDYNYVLQRGNYMYELAGHTNDYGVEIGTRDLNTGTSEQYVWRFGTDGNLLIPNSSVIRTQSWGSFSLKSDNADIVIMTDVDNSRGWTFSAFGVLAFPNNSTFDGQTLIDHSSSTNYTLKIANGGVAGSKFGIGTGDATFGIANDALNHAENGYVPYTVTAQNINLTVPGTGTWTFGTDGTLTLPGSLELPEGSTITDNRSFNNFTAGTNYTSGSWGGDAVGFVDVSTSLQHELSLLESGDFISITTVRTGTISTTVNSVYTGGPSGSLTVAVGIGGGDSITSITLLDRTASGIELTTHSNTWTFGTNGKLTLPNGATIVDTTSTLVLTPNSPAQVTSLVLRSTYNSFLTADYPTDQGYQQYLHQLDPITWPDPYVSTGTEGTVISITLWDSNGIQYVQGDVDYIITGTGITAADFTPAVLTGTFLAANWVPTGNGYSYTNTNMLMIANDAIVEGQETFTITIITTGTYGSYNGSNYLRVNIADGTTEGSESGHIHLISENMAQTSIFLGNDDKYVKVAADDQIYINVPNADTSGTSQLWTFGTDGTTTLASGVEISNTGTFNFLSWNTGTALIIADVPYTAGSYIYIPSSSDTNGSLGIVNTNTSGTIMLTQGNGNTTNQLYVNNSGTNINNILGGISKTWTFGTDGSVTFPDSTVQTTAYVPATASASTYTGWFKAAETVVQLDTLLARINSTGTMQISSTIVETIGQGSAFAWNGVRNKGATMSSFGQGGENWVNPGDWLDISATPLDNDFEVATVSVFKLGGTGSLYRITYVGSTNDQWSVVIERVAQG